MSEVEHVYREYEYVINGRKVIIKRSWTKRIKEPERVQNIKKWIAKNYDKSKNIFTNYKQYIEDTENLPQKKPTLNTFTKYYRQTKATDSTDSTDSTKSADKSEGSTNL
jgi:hypothetical protein